VIALDLWDLLPSASVDLPLILSFVFAAIAAIAIAWALWIRRTLAREAELLQLVNERTRQLEDANRRLEALSYEDALTGVANRRGFDQALGIEWRRTIRSRQPLSLLMIDIDHFKSFNDTYGHQAGDRCLASVAATLGGVVKRAGDHLARYGGEEFVALLPATDAAGAIAIAGRMRAAVHALNLSHSGGVDGRVTLSIGHATVIADDSAASTADILVAAADAALYEAKRTGRNRTAGAATIAAAAPVRAGV
jgi:diguanylate cyclase (GGDEF)-like protein